MADQELQNMLNEFVSESIDNLDQVENLIEDLGVDNNSDSVNAIFRAFHTIKGLSGFFEQMVINKVTQQAETYLDHIRKMDSAQPQSFIDVVLKSADFIRGFLDVVSEDLTDKGAEENAEALIADIKQAI